MNRTRFTAASRFAGCAKEGAGASAIATQNSREILHATLQVSNGDRVLALDSDGELIYWRADPAEFHLLDRKEVAVQSTWAHLAVAGDQIFVRELNALAVWRWGD